MGLKKYIKTIFKPAAVKRAKAMKRAKRARGAAAETAREKLIANLEKSLGYSFKDRSILREALTHPSSVGFEKKVKSNQRLEFLGDAVLQAAITDTVFRKFDDVDEGSLTKIRIALTQGSFLSDLSFAMGIPKCLILPKSAEDIRESASAAEDAFEAVVGAIYLDSNFEKAKNIVLSWYKHGLGELLPDLVSSQNPKGALQEFAAKNGDVVSYALVSQSGPDHKKVFEVEVSLNGTPLSRASASSKKSAETKAAGFALALLKKSESSAEESSDLKSTEKCERKPKRKASK